MDFQEQPDTPNEDYPFISEQQSSMLEGSARFQDAYILMRIYDESYEHYLENYADEEPSDTQKDRAHRFSSAVIDKLYPTNG